jgi:hypothetical protein
LPGDITRFFTMSSRFSRFHLKGRVANRNLVV